MTIYVGLSGTNLAGKGTVRRIIEMNYDTATYSLSDILREEARLRGIEITRENLISIGNELRKRYGAEILAKRILQKVNMEGKDEDKEVIIFDSIRNPGEIKELRNALGKKIVFFWIDASLKIRYLRAKERRREEDFLTFEQFAALDAAERSLDRPSYESNISACKGYADYIINNDGSIEQLISKINRIMSKITNEKIPSVGETIKL